MRVGPQNWTYSMHGVKMTRKKRREPGISSNKDTGKSRRFVPGTARPTGILANLPTPQRNWRSALRGLRGAPTAARATNACSPSCAARRHVGPGTYCNDHLLFSDLPQITPLGLKSADSER